MAAAPPLRVVLRAMAGELERMHADALRLQDDLSALAQAAVGRGARLEGLQGLDTLTQGLEALGGFAGALAGAAGAAPVDLDALERPRLSSMAVRLGWPAAADAPAAGDCDEACEFF